MATTTGALVQDALNISAALQKNLGNGQYVDVYVAIKDLCTANIALADALYAVLNAAATPSLTTAVATTPEIGNQYSAVQTWPVTPITGIR